MNVLVIGIGTSGKSAARFLHKKGFKVWAVDDKATQCELTFVNFVPKEEIRLQQMTFVILSPGVPLEHPLVVQAQTLGLEVICDVELAFRELQDRLPPICGITATNGKTTTTMLTCHMLKAAGFHAQAVGNIGLPLLDVLEEQNPHFVIELSSFQLQTMKTRSLDAACILNISPNHLDHHASFEEYVQCKQRIGMCVKERGTLYVNEKIEHAFTQKVATFGFSSKSDIFTDATSIYRFGVKETQLPSQLSAKRSHDVENFLAAYLLAREYGVDPEICVKAYESFTKPPHRIQFVKEVSGVRFFDDSKATNVDAVLRALDSFTTPVVLIAGGVHKGFTYAAWKEACQKKVQACVLLGEAAPIIEKDLQGIVPLYTVSTLQEAVLLAFSIARPLDSVLLSPGCSSYDMFKSYEERGKKFQEIVYCIHN